MADDAPPQVPGYTAALLFNDPTPHAIIQNRIVRRGVEMVANYTDLNDQEKADVLNLLLLIGRKMVSVWRHLEAYKAEEDRILAKLEGQDRYLEMSQELFIEFDEFTVQIKSTLDHVVKMLRPMIGRGWNITTFGDKGRDVIKALERNTGKEYEGRIKSLKYFCFQPETMRWLEAIIEARDKVNHYLSGGLKPEHFAVGKLPPGHPKIVPMFSQDQTLRDAMEASWDQLFHLVENFTIGSIHFRMLEKHSLLMKPLSLNTPRSPFQVVPKAVTDAIHMRGGFKPVE